MITLTRRNMLAQSSLLLTIGCNANGGFQTPLDMARAYGDDLADVFAAYSNLYVTNPSDPSKVSEVQRLAQEVQLAKGLFDAALSATLASNPAQTILTIATQLEPILAPLLGTVAMYIPLGLMVLQAFISKQPPPPDAPAVPPAGLHRPAALYRAQLHQKPQE